MNLIFLGPPGAGKGTMAVKASQEYAIPHISTGDLFRSAIKNQTDLGLQVKSIIDSGGLVPDSLTVEIVKERLAQGDTERGYILDGFPRTIGQAKALKAMSRVDKVINFLPTDEVILERLSGRLVCRGCGATYHATFMPPKKEGVCDACGGELYTRKDDTEEAIKNRLAVYKEQTQPLIKHYTEEGLIINLPASEGPDEVFANLKAFLDG